MQSDARIGDATLPADPGESGARRDRASYPAIPAAREPDAAGSGVRQGRASNPMLLALSSSPLPPPQLLQEYERACPGAGERIFRMAEAEQQHRHALQQQALRADLEDLQRTHGNTARGQLLGFGVVVAALAAAVVIAVYSTAWGAPVAAGIIGAGGLTSLVYVFIRGQRHRQEEGRTQPSSIGLPGGKP